MRVFFAIFKLTLQDCIRGKIFRLLVFLLMLSAVLIPYAVTGGGGTSAAADYVKIALLYSLQTTGWILGLASLWLGAQTMTQDIEDSRLQLIVSKPVSRFTVMTGKYAAVSALNITLLAFSGLLIYLGIMYQFSHRDFTPEMRQKVQDEVLTGRRVFMPDRPDIEERIRRLYNAKLELMADDPLFRNSPQEKELILDEARKEVIAGISQLQANMARPFVYSNIPSEPQGMLFLRFRPYVGEIGGNKQRQTYGAWQIGIPAEENPAQGDSRNSTGGRIDFFPLESGRRSLQGGEFHEIMLDPAWKMVTPENKIHLVYANFDEQGASQFFQPSDGPKLLLKVSSFGGNFARGLLISALMIMMMAALGCAAASCFSLPTAVFLIISYLIFGGISGYLVGTLSTGDASDVFGYYAGKAVMTVIIPIQDFDASSLLADGELVEWSMILKLFVYYYLLRALPCFLLGSRVYMRRELGIAEKK